METSLEDIFNSELRALMGRHRVSQTKLAEVLGVDQTGISSRLRGKTEWKLAEISTIAAFFGVHPAVLLGGYAKTPPPGGPDGGVSLTALPRLDSNQQPAG